MWPSPPTVTLDVHARLPSTLAIDPPISPTPGARPVRWFIEGPALTPTGDVYTVDLAGGRILRFDRGGDVSVVLSYDGRPNGLVLRDDGMLVVADRSEGLLVLDPDTGRLDVLSDSVDGGPFLGLNDVVLAGDGAVWATDQGDTGLDDRTGRLIRVEPDGSTEIVLGGIPSPNGLALVDGDTRVLVAVTRDNAIWSVPLDPSGAAHRVGRFIQMSGGTGPDGIEPGPGDTLLVAHLGTGTVWVYDRSGVPILVLRSPVGEATTNVELSDDGRVYVTESVSGCLLTTDLASFFAGHTSQQTRAGDR